MRALKKGLQRWTAILLAAALCLSLTAADGGYVMEAGDGGMGRYQVELRMVYFQAAPGGKEV